jgi:signal transduction histidine kinase
MQCRAAGDAAPVLLGIVLLAQTALIAGLLNEHRRRRTAEVESRQRMTELAHLNRQMTAGELSASIAHETQSAFGRYSQQYRSLRGNARFEHGMQEVKSILADIKAADLRATEIIQRLRRLLTKAKVETKNIDLNEIVSEVIGILAAQAAARGVTKLLRDARRLEDS